MDNRSLRILAEDRKVEILSRLLGISHPAVSKWDVIPPLRAYQIAELGDYDLHYIRPDLKVNA